MINLMPKDQKFYDELEELAGIVSGAAKHLVEVTKNFPSVGMHVGEIEMDQRADELAQVALERLDQAFITPLDREDILHLISVLYAVVETIAGFAKRVTLYGSQRIDPGLGRPGRDPFQRWPIAWRRSCAVSAWTIG
jgi:uncharacterized protein Yka (UPF0111/DUF47 family)